MCSSKDGSTQYSTKPSIKMQYFCAIEFKPSPEGYIYLISRQSKTIRIGGIIFKLIRGTPENTSNRKALMGATTACMERAFLDSLVRPKIKVQDDRYMPIEQLEDKLEKILAQSGEKALHIFRDNSRKISRELNLTGSYRRLDKIIGAILGSKEFTLHGLQSIQRASGISQIIAHPIAKGIFLSFVVSEVHPFADGNGRTYRIILNRELISEGFTSIIIPTVFRGDYLLALRALSRKGSYRSYNYYVFTGIVFFAIGFYRLSISKKRDN